MTIQEIRLNLYQHFKDNDQLILPDDKLKIITISETPELHYAAIFEALKSFEENGLVKKVEFKDGKVLKTSYVLEKPLQNYTQNITIDGETAFALSEIINALDVKQTKFLSNPLAITDIEINTAVILLKELIRKDYDKMNQEED